MRDDAERARSVLRIGGSANIECIGPEGRNLIVLSATRDAEISVLVPSIFAPDTRMPGKAVSLPTAPDFDAFHVTSDPGDHRLYSICGDDQMAGRIRDNLDRMHGVKTMDDRTAAALGALLSAIPMSRRAVAACDYIVER